MGKFHIYTQILQGNALFSGKIYTVGKKFTQPLVVTVATNFRSGIYFWKEFLKHFKLWMSGGGSIPNPDYQNIYILANLWQQMLHLFKPILPIPRSTSYNHKARKNRQPFLKLFSSIAPGVHFSFDVLPSCSQVRMLNFLEKCCK